MNERGQTTYDYLIGIVLVLVTVIAVLAFLPQVFNPFVDPVSSEERNLADRVATEIIETNSTGGERTLDDMTTINDEQQYMSDIKNRTGIWEADVRSINVSFQTDEGTIQDGIGDPRQPGEPEAQTVRNIRFAGDEICEGECHMVVRVW